MDTVFSDTPTALHVSFLVYSQQVGDLSSLRRALIRILETMPVLTRQQADMLKRLHGTRSLLVDFEGLTQHEIHGQCALIIDSVQQRLPHPELCAVFAGYGATPAARQRGINGLTIYLLKPSPLAASCQAFNALVWRYYLPREYSDGYSLRDIEKRTGCTRMTLARASVWLANELQGIELRALRRLEETFVPHGVCPAIVMQT
jgi:hypothetical protein